MRNKRIIAITIILVIISNYFIYTQEQDEIADITIPSTDLKLINKNPLSSIFPYTLTDGTKLSYTDTLKIVKSLKTNETLLKEERDCQIASRVFYMLYGIGILGWACLFTPDQRNDNIMYLLAITTGVGIPALSTKIVAEKKLDKAVHNYNLYVMGIQIPNN